MAARIYRLTAAGRQAWEGEDAGVPADYRRILWMMDLHGSAPETLAKVFPAEMLEEWLSELEELGMIELVPEGQGRPGSRRRARPVWRLPRRGSVEAPPRAAQATGRNRDPDRGRRSGSACPGRPARVHGGIQSAR